MTDAGLIAARFVHYGALTLAFGAFAYGGFVQSEASERIRRRLHGLALWSSLGVLLGSAAVLAATVAGLGGGYGAALDGSLWSAVLNETDFGRVWRVRLALAAALVLVAAISPWRSSPGLRWAGVVLAGGLIVAVALTGHAQLRTGAAGLLHRGADAAHLLAAAVWIGVLPPLLLLLSWTGPGRTVEQPEAAARRLRAFHNVGLTAVLLLVATGLINSAFLVGSVDRLFTTPYGGLLLAKLALFFGMVGLAARNRLRLVPALTRDLSAGVEPSDRLRRLRTTLRGELILAFLVLLAVAVMGTIAPASAGA